MLSKQSRILGWVLTGCVGVVGVAFLGWRSHQLYQGNQEKLALMELGRKMAAATPIPGTDPLPQGDRSALLRPEPQGDLTPSGAQETARETVLARATVALAEQATRALDGRVSVNGVLDQMLAFAALPVATPPDLDESDSDDLVYRLEGTPDGVQAQILVGMEPFSFDGAACRSLKLNVNTRGSEAEFLQGAMRATPNIELSVCYEVDDPSKLTRFVMSLRRDVDLRASRDAGVDAYHGEYAVGADYWLTLWEGADPLYASTMGMVDGNYAYGKDWPGAQPLAGDLNADPARVAALLEQLYAQLETIKGN